VDNWNWAATDRIVEEFNRLVAIGQERMPEQSYAERVLYFVVATRCEIDMEGFQSVYEQAFTPWELNTLIDGLRRIGENKLAEEFAEGFGLVNEAGFYNHKNWNLVPEEVKERINEIGERVGDQLWTLDEKLVALLDENKEE
jgi:hypothetical protein